MPETAPHTHFLCGQPELSAYGAPPGSGGERSSYESLHGEADEAIHHHTTFYIISLNSGLSVKIAQLLGLSWTLLNAKTDPSESSQDLRSLLSKEGESWLGRPICTQRRFLLGLQDSHPVPGSTSSCVTI